MTKISTIAAFDFDGTISYHDTFVPFLIFAKGLPITIFNTLQELPALLTYAWGSGERQWLKERFIKRFFQGMAKSELEAIGEAYATGPLTQKLKPEAIEKIRSHQKLGHRCILLSAALDIYLKPWAEMMGFNDLLCSEVATDQNKCVTGKLKGTNCRGKEKVKRLESLLGSRSEYLLYAYGDSPGDHEMLMFADYPYYCAF